LKLLETPVKAAEHIIYSDHKNMILTLSVLSSIKISLFEWIIFNAFSDSRNIPENLLIVLIVGLFVFIASVFIISFSKNIILKRLGLITRIKDFYAITTYSFLPIVLVFFVLTPIQIALFGTYWFTFNPSPFLIKPVASYILFIIEFLFLIWTLFLLITSNYAQVKNVFLSLILGIIDLLIIISTNWGSLYFISFI
jgi:hypothetical protein